ncbi:MAG: GNAT family N-acetyltransferase [Rubrivivax sp.]|nr:GNAT family N-acetyltransferase [Rubrivivax sp.]
MATRKSSSKPQPGPQPGPQPRPAARKAAASRPAGAAPRSPSHSTSAASGLVVHPLTPARWPDVEALFNAKGCSMARGCWCMAYRQSGHVTVPAGQSMSDFNRNGLRALTEAGQPPPGLIAYRGKEPVGWVSLGPREQFARLARSPVMGPVDDRPVWSIICFVVPTAHRHQGVAHTLLQGAIEFAARHRARLLEAYPVDKAVRGADAWMWFGAKSMYDRAGFTEVARRKPERPVVRLVVEPGPT